MTDNVIPIGETEKCLTCKRRISVEFITYNHKAQNAICLSCLKGNKKSDNPEEDGVKYLW